MPSSPELTALMDRAARGDDDAFAGLVSQTQNALFRFALAHGLRRADAAETVQETFLRAYRSRRKWKPGSSATGWLYGIAMNIVRETRRRRFGRESASLEIDIPTDDTSISYDEAEEQSARLTRMGRALGGLPERQREALVCRYLRQMSVRETAQAMGCAEGTVKAAVHAAIGNLKQNLGVQP